jgi:hypothetical protein
MYAKCPTKPVLDLMTLIIAAMYLALFLLILEVPTSNFSAETGYPD